MTDFEKTYQNYNPRAAALAEARALLTEAAKAAMADGTLAEAELPLLSWRSLPTPRTVTSLPIWPWPVPAPGARPPR